jgi:hypothetical protein
MFLSQGQLGTMTEAADLSSWQICGRYDFPNVRRPDVHYLLVKPALAAEVCQATGRVPVAADSLSDREWVARCAGPEEGEGCGVARGQKTH